MTTGVDDAQQQQLRKTLLMCTESLLYSRSHNDVTPIPNLSGPHPCPRYRAPCIRPQSPDGWQTFNCESDSQYCWHPSWASREHSAKWIKNVEGFHKMGAVAFGVWPKADQADYVTSKPGYFFLKKTKPIFLTVFSRGVSVGSTTLSQRAKHNRSSGSTLAHPLKEGKAVSSAGKLMSPVFWEAKALCS